MRIREEALPFAVPLLVLAAALVALGQVWPALPPAALGLFVCAFFRDPERVSTVDPRALLCPADGRVCQVAREGGRTKISVFMSLFDVHVNRSPEACTVSEMTYNRGRFLAAWSDKASLDNEQLRYRLATPRGELELVQIAGLVARRIVPFVAVGAVLGRGERFGLIRFGSRVDLYAPEGVEVLVRVGQRVRAGATPLALWGAP